MKFSITDFFIFCAVEAVNILNNSALKERGVLQMDFGANKTPVEITKKDAFGWTYFREIYSGVNKK